MLVDIFLVGVRVGGVGGKEASATAKTSKRAPPQLKEHEIPKQMAPNRGGWLLKNRRPVHARAAIAAHFINHADFFPPRSFHHNWVTFAPEPPGKQGLLFLRFRGLATRRLRIEKSSAHTHTHGKHAAAL